MRCFNAVIASLVALVVVTACDRHPKAGQPSSALTADTTTTDWLARYKQHPEEAWPDRLACQSGKISRAKEETRCSTALNATMFGAVGPAPTSSNH